MTRRTNLRLAALASIAALAIAAAPAVQAAGPTGFDAPASAEARAPQGFGNNKVTTVQWVLENGADDQVVVLRGKFTQHLRGDKYEFEDEAGTAITAELDHDRDWSMVKKDAPMEIRAEIDRDWNRTKLDVRSAKPLE